MQASPGGSRSDLATILWRRLGREDGARIGFYDRADRAVREQSQHQFLQRAAALAVQLRASGAEPGDKAVVVAPAPEAALLGYLGCVMSGIVPLLHAARPAFDDKGRFMDGLARTLDRLGASTWLIVQAKDTAPAMSVPEWERTVLVEPRNLAASAVDAAPFDGLPGSEVCHLQATSGSTGEGKLVLVTHDALLANIAASHSRMGMSGGSTVVSWLPLYHDLGLVGQALLALLISADLHLFAPFDFLAEPAAWLRAISDKRATVTAAPNFALDYTCRRTRDDQLPGVDLSSLTHLAVGAEPVSARTLAAFHERFAPYGLRREAIHPCYGLAEIGIGAVMPPVDRPARWITVQTADIHRLGSLEVVGAGELGDQPSEQEGLSDVVSLGPPFDGVEIWLRDPDGHRFEDDDRCGEVMIEGSSVTGGYLHADGTVEPFPERTVATGDIGFFHEGDLYVVERIKNVIIRSGQNHSAQVLEEELSALTGLPLDQVAVIDSDLRSGRGRVTAIVELERRGDPSKVEAAVRAGLDRFELALEELVLVRPGSIPRTTSGKKRHSELRIMLQAGTLKVVDRVLLTGVSGPEPEAGDVLDLDEIDALSRVHSVVERIASDRGHRGAIRETDRFTQDLGFDSLAIYETAMAVESDLDLEITEEDLGTVRTVGDLIELVRKRRRDPRSSDDGQRGITRTILSLQDAVPQVLKQVKAQRGRKVLIDGRWVTDFASCNYLGLDLHPDVIAAIPPMIDEFGVHPSWTRAVASPAPYRRLEQALADLIGSDDTVVFPTVTLTHLGVLPKLAAPSGTLLVDQDAHRSIQEAAELARARGATVRTFPHGDHAALERILAEDKGLRRIIAVDGVYSMAGAHEDVAALQELARRYDAVVYVDDAHGFGVIGERPHPSLPYGLRGNGVVRHLGLDYDRTIYVAGLSKAYSSMGAFISCNSPEERRLVESASTLVFGGPVPTASLASALAGLKVNEREGDLLRLRLYNLTRQLVDSVTELGFQVDNDAAFPIVNVVLGSIDNVQRAAEILWDHGILMTPSVFPATPLDRGGVRFTVTAANTESEIQQLVDALTAVREVVGIGARRSGTG